MTAVKRHSFPLGSLSVDRSGCFRLDVQGQVFTFHREVSLELALQVIEFREGEQQHEPRDASPPPPQPSVTPCFWCRGMLALHVFHENGISGVTASHTVPICTEWIDFLEEVQGFTVRHRGPPPVAGFFGTAIPRRAPRRQGPAR